MRRRVRVKPNRPPPRSIAAPSPIPSALLLSSASMAPPSVDLVLPLLLLLLMCSSGSGSYPLLHYPRRCSPSSIAATQQLSPAIESQDSGRDLCQTGRRSGRTVEAPGCSTDSTVSTAYRSPTDRLREMEAPTTVEVVRLGSTKSVRLAVLSQSVAPVVLGVDPVDQWRCVSSDELPAPLRG
jgi:hypothetical protein